MNCRACHSPRLEYHRPVKDDPDHDRSWFFLRCCACGSLSQSHDYEDVKYVYEKAP